MPNDVPPSQWWRPRSAGPPLLMGAVLVTLGVLVWSWFSPLRRAERLLATGQAEMALRLADEALRKDPSHHQGLSIKARAHTNLENWQLAEQCFEQFAHHSVEDQRAWSKVLLHRQRFEDGRILLNTLLESQSTEGAIAVDLVNCEMELGLWTVALQHAKQLERLPTWRVASAWLQGRIHERQGSAFAAICAWQPLADETCDWTNCPVSRSTFLRELGAAYVAEGLPRAALPFLQRSLDLDNSHEVRERLAEAWQLVGDELQAKTAWRDVLKHAPESLTARTSLATLELQQNRPREAIQWLESATVSEFASAEVAYLMQRCFTVLQDHGLATLWQRRAETLRRLERLERSTRGFVSPSNRERWSLIIAAYRAAFDGRFQDAARWLPSLHRMDETPFLLALCQAIESNREPPNLDGLLIHD